MLIIPQHFTIPGLRNRVEQVQVPDFSQVGAPQMFWNSPGWRGRPVGPTRRELYGEPLKQPIEFLHICRQSRGQKLRGFSLGTVFKCETGSAPEIGEVLSREALVTFIHSFLEASKAVGGRLHFRTQLFHLRFLVPDDRSPHAQIDLVAHLVVDLVEFVSQLVAVELSQLIADEPVVQNDITKVVEPLRRFSLVVARRPAALLVCGHVLETFELADAVHDTAGLVGEHLFVLTLDQF
ncbi:oligopeptide transport ATP-binding protein, putative [Babesia ovata]|uniref:Oligopeptide transport ATP-binding protein, putative n=1 Tax=Babesia ovata TaxID=189622 RepID=A0A2H6KB97_9APIC|nr:oligopeptide transport ATP-binding protein, putative [Babesia ovata]GBE60268.1 oligopeptide transport ATP-binding protein, putative [Babesia ovata]